MAELCPYTVEPRVTWLFGGKEHNTVIQGSINWYQVKLPVQRVFLSATLDIVRSSLKLQLSFEY